MTKSIEKLVTTPARSIWAISFLEILLICFYFIAVWLIPVSWLNSGFGTVAFAIASKINPYLSEYSIAFAKNPEYFIHCHVLASWIIAPGLVPLIVKSNGGKKVYAKLVKERIESFGGAFYYIAFACVSMSILYFGMLFLVDFPLGRGERAIWISGVSYSALMMSGIMSLWLGVMFMSFYTQLLICSGKLK